MKDNQPSSDRPYAYGQRLKVDPPLTGEGNRLVPEILVITDDGQRMIVRSATKGAQLTRVTALVPGEGGVTITPVD